MGYERSAWIALVSTSLLILLVAAQEIIRPPVIDEVITPAPAIEPMPGIDEVIEPAPPGVDEFIRPAPVCAGSYCTTDIEESPELSCCQCEATFSSRYDVLESCTYCPSDYWCWPSISILWWPTPCCPAGWRYDRVTGRCTRLTASIPSTVVSSKCDRMYLSITADDIINDLFLDGVSYNASMVGPRGWAFVKTFEIPANTRVIAVNSSDIGYVIAGVLASTTNDYLLTSTAWKCTSRNNLPANWMATTFDDYSPPNAWPNAVFQHYNTAANRFHGALPNISASAAWIWTANYRSPIDTPVYCRGYFPTADCNSVNSGCNLAYGKCTNLCTRGREGTCCGCELDSFGPSMVCNCCPRGYKCCGKYRCCPENSSCQLDGQCLEVFNLVSSVVKERSCRYYGYGDTGDARPPDYNAVDESV